MGYALCYILSVSKIERNAILSGSTVLFLKKKKKLSHVHVVMLNSLIKSSHLLFEVYLSENAGKLQE